MLHRGAIEIANTNLAAETGQREVDQQPTVLTARVGGHHVSPSARVWGYHTQGSPLLTGVGGRSLEAREPLERAGHDLVGGWLGALVGGL